MSGGGGGGEGEVGGWVGGWVGVGGGAHALGVGASPTRMMRSSSLQPLMRRKASSVLSLWWNSTKQKPHGVFVYRSSPMITRFTSPLREKSS